MNNSSASFKGLAIPYSLIDEIGMHLSLKLSAFDASNRFKDFEISKVDPLSIFDIEILIAKGICEYWILNEKDVIEILKSKTPQIISIYTSLEECSWCKGYTCVLHSLSNYPILRNNGRKKPIQICPNCHSEFRRLIGCKIFRIKEEYSKCFNELYEERNNE